MAGFVPLQAWLLCHASLRSRRQGSHPAWLQAAALYEATGAHDRLAAALYAGDDWAGLIRLSAGLPPGTPLLLRIGAWLQSAGLAPEAADAFIKVRTVV